jgi:hypothetical protein
MALMSTTLLGTVGSIGISYQFGQNHMQNYITFLSTIGIKLGVPDILMKYKDLNEDCIPLWATEVSVSQIKKYMMGQLSNYMKDCKDLLTISLVNVKEVEKHTGPQSGLEVIEILEGRPSVSTFSEWLSYTITDNEDSIVIETFSHTWQHSITATVTIWLCHPDGSFNMNDEGPDGYATAVHC